MTKENLNQFMIIGSIITASGFILIFFSTKFGISMADNWLRQQGGADTTMFLIRIESYINNFLVAGGILFGIGLSTIIIAYFLMLNIKEQ